MSETGHLERNQSAGSAPPQAAGPRGTRSFWTIALVFTGLLAIGLTLALVVYRTYVAYEPKAARHVPEDARAVLRFDLTHVMFYEPFRRSIFPLVDYASPTGKPRRERLAERGIRVGADVREVLLAVGPAPADWVVVVGGPLPRNGLGATIAKLLREEGLSVAERSGAFVLSGAELAFAQAEDGAFVLASGEERLRKALPARGLRTELMVGAGGFSVDSGVLTPELGALGGSFRTGSVVVVELEVAPTAGASVPAEGAVRTLLDQFGRLHPALERPAEQASLEAAGSATRARLLLPREAVEAVFATVAGRVSGTARAP